MATKKSNAASKSNSKKQSQAKKPSTPFVKAKIDQLCDYGEGSSIRAYASAVIGNSFAVHGIKVYEGENGLFVAMPNRKVGEEYTDTFHAISKEGRDRLQKSVLAAYEQELKQTQENEMNEDEQSEEQAENEDEDHSMRQTM